MDLVPLLEELGLQGIRDQGKEITALCPMHEARTGKPDRHPSWSINRETGAHICFSCGWSGGLNALYMDLGFPVPTDLDLQIKVDTAKARVSRLQEAFPETKGNQGNDELITKSLSGSEVPVIWTEQRLRAMKPVPYRLADHRLLQPQALHAYQILWNSLDKCWVLPVRDEYGELMGVQLRQKGVERNQPEGMEKSTTLFGLSMVSKLSSTHVALVESPLDAVRLFGVGIPAVASFGAFVSKEQVELLCRYFQVVVLALDNDKVGREAADRVERQLRGRVFVTRLDYGDLDGKDPGDITSDELLREAWNRSLNSGLTSERPSTRR